MNYPVEIGMVRIYEHENWTGHKCSACQQNLAFIRPSNHNNQPMTWLCYPCARDMTQALACFLTTVAADWPSHASPLP